MVIRDDFSFEVHMQGNQVQTQLFEIETVECVGDVMSNISSSRLCCGNQDDKFHPLSDVRKGKFVDTKGKVIKVELMMKLTSCRN